MDIVEGSQFTVPLTIRSEIRFAPANVRFAPAEIQALGTASHSVSLNEDVLPSLGPGLSESVRIYGTAPAFTSKQQSPDIYHFLIRAKAKGGFARFERSIEAPLHELWVCLLCRLDRARMSRRRPVTYVVWMV